MFDVVIENGLFFDGTGAPGALANVAISDGRDAPAGDGDVGQRAGRAGAVEEQPVFDDHVEHATLVT